MKEAAVGVQLGGSCAILGGRGAWLGWGCRGRWLSTDGGNVGVSGGADSQPLLPVTGGLAPPFGGGKTGETRLVDVVGKGEGKNNIKFELPVRPLRGL